MRLPLFATALAAVFAVAPLVVTAQSGSGADPSFARPTTAPAPGATTRAPTTATTRAPAASPTNATTHAPPATLAPVPSNSNSSSSFAVVRGVVTVTNGSFGAVAAYPQAHDALAAGLRQSLASEFDVSRDNVTITNLVLTNTTLTVGYDVLCLYADANAIKSKAQALSGTILGTGRGTQVQSQATIMDASAAGASVGFSSMAAPQVSLSSAIASALFAMVLLGLH